MVCDKGGRLTASDGRLARVAIALVAALGTTSLAACSRQEPASTSSPPSTAATQPVSPSSNPEKNAYFGDLHLHTGFSADAALMTVTAPDDAYRYAKGEAIPRSDNQTIQLKRPLDFLAVTDHAEYVGVVPKFSDPKSPLYSHPLAPAFRGNDSEAKLKAYGRIAGDIANATPEKALMDPAVAKSVWQIYSQEAAKHYQPGKFTSFIAFEWTSTPKLQNMHRNVIFGNTTVPEVPFSAFDSDKPEDLWTYLENARAAGGEVIAISHNGNLSSGLMFAETDSYGKPLDAAYARRRRVNEVAHEIIQGKGQSEIHASIAPNDEFAGFENATFRLGDFKVLSGATLDAKHSYVREAYKTGLRIADKVGENPYQFGLVAGSDSHVGGGSPEEDNWKGVHGTFDSTPEARIVKPEMPYAYAAGSGGLTGIWAEQNTRESLFAALKRNETFGTSGVRLRPRFFAGWNFSADTLRNGEWLKTAYRDGVPMGGELSKAPNGAKAPTFIVAAAKDPAGANLDRIQIIKGWSKNGQTFDKIYDVALSDGRKVDPATGKAPPVGNTVNIKTATYSNSIGAAELTAVWTDPDFDPTVRSFYYVRVLEIPTPRWSTYDAVKLGIAPRKDVEATIQERAWTSPIWYKP